MVGLGGHAARAAHERGVELVDLGRGVVERAGDVGPNRVAGRELALAGRGALDDRLRRRLAGAVVRAVRATARGRGARRSRRCFARLRSRATAALPR